MRKRYHAFLVAKAPCWRLAGSLDGPGAGGKCHAFFCHAFFLPRVMLVVRGAAEGGDAAGWVLGFDGCFPLLSSASTGWAKISGDSCSGIQKGEKLHRTPIRYARSIRALLLAVCLLPLAAPTAAQQITLQPTPRGTISLRAELPGFLGKEI
ncbi:MAG: hypothetical protein HC888_06850, partial [Candidatus Competibacteraceae bacterium]|nr:hypothetical protein [Candidatus Competibacteraceae bacterium]